MNNKGYINIQGWMIREDLSLSESTVWAVIYGFSQSGKGEYHGSLSYIENALKISRNTVIRIIKKLIAKKCIKKTKQSHYIGLYLASAETELVQKLVVQNLTSASAETGTLASAETEHNNYNTNNKEKNTSEATSQGKLLNEFIEELKPLNEIGYTRWFSNKTQRKSVGLLMKKFTVPQIRKLIEFIELNKSKEYFPAISTPTQLVDKMPQVEKFYKSKGYKKQVPQVIM